MSDALYRTSLRPIYSERVVNELRAEVVGVARGVVHLLEEEPRRTLERALKLLDVAECFVAEIPAGRPPPLPEVDPRDLKDRPPLMHTWRSIFRRSPK